MTTFASWFSTWAALLSFSFLLAERLSFCSCLLSALADCVGVASAVSFFVCLFWDTACSFSVVDDCSALTSTWFVWLIFGCSFSWVADNDWPFCEFWEFCTWDSRFSVCSLLLCCFCLTTLAGWFVSAACACDVLNPKNTNVAMTVENVPTVYLRILNFWILSR